MLDNLVKESAVTGEEEDDDDQSSGPDKGAEDSVGSADENTDVEGSGDQNDAEVGGGDDDNAEIPSATDHHNEVYVEDEYEEETDLPNAGIHAVGNNSSDVSLFSSPDFNENINGSEREYSH